jgi:hypothetical protein
MVADRMRKLYVREHHIRPKWHWRASLIV